MSDREIHLEAPAAAAPVSPLKEVWTIAWPTVLTMTSYTVMQFFDKLMVGQVGPTALAAQSNGGIWSFSALSFALGVLTVVNTYVSQNLGAGTPRNGPKYAWAAMWLSLTIWIFVLLPYGFVLPLIFPHLEGHSPELVQMEVAYAQTLIFGSIFMLLGRSVSQFFFGMHRPRVVTFAAILANIANIFGNYVLIFGREGLPGWGLPGVLDIDPMGVRGAALSTVMASGLEMLIPLCIFLGPKLNAQLATRSAWRPRWNTMRDLLKIGWPAAVQWGNELICWAIFMSVLVGVFGPTHMAAAAIAMGYMHLSFMPAVGLSVATNSLVGKYIGAGQPDIAAARAYLCMKVAMTYMTICAALFVLLRYQLVSIFLGGQDVDPAQAAAILNIGTKVLICTALFQTADSLGMVFTGALRGAGDTVWPGVVTMIYSWVFIVGLGAVMVTFLPQLESLGPWIASAIYIILYGLTMWRRFASGRWRDIKLLEQTGEKAAPRAVEAGFESAPPITSVPDADVEMAGVGESTTER